MRSSRSRACSSTARACATTWRTTSRTSSSKATSSATRRTASRCSRPISRRSSRESMAKSGAPEIVNERAAAQTWDGRRLPGPWLTLRALDTAATMAATHGTGTVVIRRSHHIACLAAYLIRAAERGVVAIVQSSDPLLAAVVPHGGVTPIMTPNPIAAGIPTSGDPCSSTSRRRSRAWASRTRNAPPAAACRDRGSSTARATRPTIRACCAREPKGALLPLGGLDAGLQGLRPRAPGRGADRGARGIRPRRSAGGLGRHRLRAGPRSRGLRRSRRVPAADGPPRARRARIAAAPGRRARAPARRSRSPRRREQRAEGVALYPAIMPALEPWARKLGVTPPSPLP